MPTWLISGASGFLGANVGLWLEGRVTRVAIARGRVGASCFDSVVAADLLDPPSVMAAVAEVRPDVIVHAAALASHAGCEAEPTLAHRMNVDAARTMAQAAVSVGARLAHISTDAVFDGTIGNYRETDAVSPFSVYGETKLLGEQAVASVDPTALIARTNFFGWSPSGTRSILEFFVNALTAGTPVSGYTDFVVTSIYAQHLASALFSLANGSASGIVHVASSDPLSKYHFGLEVARVFGLDAGLIAPTSTGSASDGISRTRDLSLNTDLAASLIGTPLPSQAAGVDLAYRERRLSAVFAQ